MRVCGGWESSQTQTQPIGPQGQPLSQDPWLLPRGCGPPDSQRHLSHLNCPCAEPMLPLGMGLHALQGIPHSRASGIWGSVSSPIGELPLGSHEPYLRSHSRSGQTKSLAPFQGCGPPNGPLEDPWASSRVGTQPRSACAAALCSYLEARGDPAALGCLPAPCPRQKPAVSLHLWEEQMACDPARWSQ